MVHDPTQLSVSGINFDMTRTEKLKRLSASIFFGVCLLVPTTGSAQDPQLVSTPAKCVSMKQGRTCYQEVVFHWKTDEVANYCLYQQDEEKPLKCWTQQNQGYIDYQFSEKNSLSYVLRFQNSEDDIISTTVEVKWVYKRHSDRYGWRIF